MTYRDFEIKKKNGSRKISAPSPKLLRAQRALATPLNHALQAIAHIHDVDEVIHGFRYNHNCVTAAHHHKGFKTTLSMDISNFFNSVTRTHFDYSDLTLPDYVFHREGYTAQGFATSPILANIAIIPALVEIKNLLTQLRVPFAFTIYADDIQISTNFEDINIIISHIAKHVEKILIKYGFTANLNKTRVHYAKYGARRILGMNVTDEVTMTRKIRRKIRAARHQNNGPSLGGLTTWSQCRLPNNYN